MPDNWPEQSAEAAPPAGESQQNLSTRWDSSLPSELYPTFLSKLPASTTPVHSPLRKDHTRNPVLIKAYLVCFATKAVHLEVIEDLSTEDFQAGLKRFISRRGLPSEIHSDNGKNFVGAKNDLHQLYNFLQTDQVNSSISSYLLSQRIDWICIPECSPHFGGLWEAAVKSTKFHLKRITGALRFTISELHIVICQIEACLNSRPLSPINSHSMDGVQVLTPGHFLVGRPLTCYPETIIDTQPSLLKCWTMCQSIVHHFWLRWSIEYLQQMQVIEKWRSPTPNLRRETSSTSMRTPPSLVVGLSPWSNRPSQDEMALSELFC